MPQFLIRILRYIEMDNMREVRFRGKDKQTGEMRYGYYCNVPVTYNPWGNPLTKEEWFKKTTTHYIIFTRQGDWNLPHFTFKVEVEDPEVFVGEYTEEGEEIWEKLDYKLM